MARKLVAPEGVTSANHMGDQYLVDTDGTVVVPDSLAKLLMESHGFRPHGEKRPGVRTVHRSLQVQTGYVPLAVADDDEAITDDEAPPLNEYPSPAEFSAGLTQRRMKQFLASEHVPVPRTGTVRDLRALVEETYAKALASHLGGDRAEAPTPPAEATPAPTPGGAGTAGGEGGDTSGTTGGAEGTGNTDTSGQSDTKA